MSISREGREHYVDWHTEVNRSRVTTQCRFVGAVDELAYAAAVRDAGAVLRERRGNRHIVNLLESSAALAFQRAGAGNKHHWCALTPGLHHRWYSIGKALRPHQANSGFAGDSGVSIRQVSRYLLVRTVDNRDPAFGESLKGWIAKTPTQGKDLSDTLFMKCLRQQGASTDFFVFFHHL